MASCSKDKDGLLVCNKCGQHREVRIKLMNFERVMPCMCECQQKEEKSREEAEKQIQLQYMIERLRQKGLTDKTYFNCKFENDDSPNSPVSQFCKEYVKNFEKAKDKNMGIIFTGGFGTGKSFYACSIANALIDRGISALVTSLPYMLNRLQSSQFKQEVFDDLIKPDLLVVDDLGSERGTDYALEQVFILIDTRLRSGKPLIVTTNLSMNELKNPENRAYGRIYDRILGMCKINFKIDGESRRTKNINQEVDTFMQEIGG